MGSKNRKSKKGGISQVKKKNIKGGKMSSGKKTKAKPVVLARKKLQANIKKKLLMKKGKSLDSTKPPESEVDIDDVLQMMDEEDLVYMKSKEYKDRQNFVINSSSNQQRTQKGKGGKKRKADNEDDELEENYEKKLVKLEERSKKYKELLPVKTKSGLQIQLTEEVEEAEEVKVYPEQPVVEKKGEVTYNGDIISYAKLVDQRQQVIEKYKIRIGNLAEGFLSDPNNRIRNVDALLMMMTTCDPAVSLLVPNLCISTLVVIFTDILPSYAIKHSGSDGVKLKKDTLQLQNFENALLAKYKLFLKKLEHLVTKYCPRKGSIKSLHEAESKLGSKAMSAMCSMLSSHPYFNMSTNIANFVVPFLNNWNANIRSIVFGYIKGVFRNDKRGEISYQIVRRINEVVKKIFARQGNHGARPELLNVLLALRIKEADLQKEKEEEIKPGQKMTFEQRRMLSKRQRKKAKELVLLEKELLEASAEENKERKSHFLTEITKLMFTIYFKVLKSEVTSGLLNCVLEGLSKFAHVINVDFFDDLISALGNLLFNKGLTNRQSLLCISTILGVLDGQGSALNVDPTIFHKTLYGLMPSIDCGVADNICGLALRCMRSALGRRKMPGPRAVAFAKRLGTLSLQVEHYDVLAALVELKNILRIHPTVEKLLDSQEGPTSSGVYIPDLSDPDHSCAESTMMWEITTLLNHYNPSVVQVSKHVLESQDTKMPLELTKMSPEQICHEFDPKPLMEFFPSPPERKLEPFKGRKGRRLRFREPADMFGLSVDDVDIEEVDYSSFTTD